MKNRKHGIPVKFTAYILSAVLLSGSAVPASAAAPDTQKDENVYANLGHDGSVEGIYVVNEYLLEEGAELVDYGKYDSVKNLTTDADISRKGDTVSVTAPEGRFFYQGNLITKELPWEISIRYFLDGREMQAGELAGKNGSLKITIHVGKNDKVDEAFFENYLLQATVPMDMDKCSRLQAAGAVMGNAGNSKQLVYNILAGQEKDIVITADVLDFSMESISFQGVPMNLELDREKLSMDSLTDKAGDIRDAADEFSDGTAELYDGADALKKGASDLQDGANSLKEGIESYSDGAHSLGDGIDTLRDGTDELADGSAQLADGISSLKEGVDKLADGYSGEEGAAAGAKKLAEGAEKLKSGAGELSKGIAAFVEMIGKLGDTTELDAQADAAIDDIINGIKSSVPPDMYERLKPKGNTAEERLQDFSKRLDSLITLVMGMALKDSSDPGKNVQEENQKASNSVLGNSIPEEKQEETQEETQKETDSEEETAAGENQTEESEAGERQTEESNTEESRTEESQTEEFSTEESKTQESNTEESQTGEIPKKAENKEQSGNDSPKQPEEAGLKENNEGKQAGEMTDAAFVSGKGAYALVTLNYTGSRHFHQPRHEGEVIRTALVQGMDTPAMIQQILQAKSGVDILLGAYQTMNALKAQLNDPAAKEQMGQLTAGSSALADGVASLADGAKALSDGIGQLAEGTSQLQSGAAELNDGGQELADGTKELQDGVSELADGARVLTDASDDLKDGTSQLADGAGDFFTGTKDLTDGVKDLKEGTDEFKDKTYDIDTQVDDEIDRVVNDFSGSDFTPVSFVSDKNMNIGLVQFIMKTESIKLPDKEKTETVEEPLTFWQRLINLFRKNSGHQYE